MIQKSKVKRNTTKNEWQLVTEKSKHIYISNKVQLQKKEIIKGLFYQEIGASL